MTNDIQTRPSSSSFTLSAMLVLSLLLAAISLQAQQRPPAVPLVTFDPNFSIWSMSDKLTDSNTRQWTGAEQPLTGLVRIDGANFRFMGADPGEVPAIAQVSLRVSALHTVYVFEAAGIHLTVTFFTPSLPQDLDALSRPVTYLSWAVSSIDARPHKVSLLIDVSPRVAVDTQDRKSVV